MICMLVQLASGCQVPESPPLHRKTIQELYGDAVVASQSSMQSQDAYACELTSHENYVPAQEYIELDSTTDYEDLNIDSPAPVFQAPANDVDLSLIHI